MHVDLAELFALNVPPLELIKDGQMLMRNLRKERPQQRDDGAAGT